ncbi:hypothetical protein [Streptomyces bobili]|uniref:hypothetical protein n=1 Tax=Streptomyces bobili TaxID=67280 RepID=UPI00117BEFE0|nr:hypothetical protein [Streptomyces bobili]
MLDLRGPLDDAQQRVIAAGADWHFARLVPFGDDGRPGVTARTWRSSPQAAHGPIVRRGPGADALTGEGVGAFQPPGRPCPPEPSGQA